MDTFETQECATRNSGPRRFLGSLVLNRVLNFTVNVVKRVSSLTGTGRAEHSLKVLVGTNNFFITKILLSKKTFCLKQGSEQPRPQPWGRGWVAK